MAPPTFLSLGNYINESKRWYDHPMISSSRLLLVAAAAIPLVAQQAVPPIWPQIQGIFPGGGQRGTEVAVSLKGRNLQGSKEVIFQSSKLKAKVVSASAYETKLLVNVAADAEPGRHDIRLIAPYGSATGYFDVSTFTVTVPIVPPTRIMLRAAAPPFSATP